MVPQPAPLSGPLRVLVSTTIAAGAFLFAVQFALGTPLLGFVGLLAVVAAANRLPAETRLRGALLGLAGATVSGSAVPALVFELEAGARFLDGSTTLGVAVALSLVALWLMAELAARTLAAADVQ